MKEIYKTHRNAILLLILGILLVALPATAMVQQFSVAPSPTPTITPRPTTKPTKTPTASMVIQGTSCGFPPVTCPDSETCSVSSSGAGICSVGGIVAPSVSPGDPPIPQDPPTCSVCLGAGGKYLCHQSFLSIVCSSSPMPGYSCTDCAVAITTPSVSPSVPAISTSPTATPIKSSITPSVTVSPSVTTTTTPSTTITPSTTTTPASGDTQLKIAASLTGIGGKSTLGENTSPKHSKVSATISILDTSNHEVAKKTVDTTFNSSAFTYDATIPLALAPGSYIVKVKFPNTLVRTIPGFVNIAASTTPTTVTLISGDINGDNILDSADYDLVISCLKKAATCTDATIAKADLNDDGSVDILDLNIILSGLARRAGD